VRQDLASAARYVAAGVINAVITYALFVVLLAVLGYALAYTLVFAIGIALGYVLQAKMVFRRSVGWPGRALVAANYLLQYFIGLALISLLVKSFAIDPRIAMLVVLAITVPLGYVISRAIFLRSARRPACLRR
jgi:putative flippase GtrA